MLEYGESRDRYFRTRLLPPELEHPGSYALNQEQYTSEKSMAQHYANQKVLPRAVLVRRARFAKQFQAAENILLVLKALQCCAAAFQFA
jgi:hypothetical protein